jgi:DNA invertase Pin-like site-specific DNA recombinase
VDKAVLNPVFAAKLSKSETCGELHKAEFERDLIRDRTEVGRRDALSRGVQFGRPSKLTEEQLKLARKLLKQGESIRYVANMLGVHFTALYGYLRA